ncbi:AraC-like DNA-binding protein/mannose-6-phosphate isomerase-like protein (cupin superfamily) [Pedobacter sp. CAN_A7]|uniref:helix-turn-helix domain-containing protein n=1 Tax=Pedobacter sp. CAN_A7 TaxID=2787722 RepID=UPI0018CBAB24
MPEKVKTIPVNSIADEFGAGVSILKASIEDSSSIEGLEHAHRHDAHLFFLLERGSITMEIDFQAYQINSPSIIYMHPSQVHRMRGAFKKVTACGWTITNECLNPEYLKLLEDIVPAKPLLLNDETYAVFAEATSLCIKLSERRHEKLYQALLKGSCNTLVGLILSQYLQHSKSADTLSRFETINKSFKVILEQSFIKVKTPAAYAQVLNISTPYLNECVKNATGHSVSYHIQQRIILEAKRLLYHSDKSVKEIASELGYDDYPYFSRLFTKVSGMSALSFRNKNLD